MQRFRQAVPVAALALLCAGPALADDASFADRARSTVVETATRVSRVAQDISLHALSMLGVEYRWGGETPERGFDCSGLVRYVFQQVTGVTLPRTAKEMSQVGQQVALHDLKPGDLVFFNTRRFAFSHVGIYLGDNRFVHAPAKGREVEVAQINSTYWRRQFDGARRLADVIPGLVPSVIGVSDAVAAPAIRGTFNPVAPPADDPAEP
jgi:cell wall-associated NlpC family hydrolase